MSSILIKDICFIILIKNNKIISLIMFIKKIIKNNSIKQFFYLFICFIFNCDITYLDDTNSLNDNEENNTNFFKTKKFYMLCGVVVLVLYLYFC